MANPEQQDNIKANDTITNSEEGDKKLTDLVTSLQSAMLRIGEPHLPVWSSDWCDSENQTTFKAHVKAFENYATLLSWDNKIKALKFQMTLRGGIRTYIDTLSTEISKDYDKLKPELMSVYHQEKDASTKIHDWNLIVWRPKPPVSMSLQSLGAILLTKFKSFSKEGESAELSQIMLKKRFIEAIAEGDSKFAAFIKLNLPADKNYKELIEFCAKKYQVFKHLKDVEEETTVGALYAGYRPTTDFSREGQRKSYGGDRFNRQGPIDRSEVSEYDRRRQMWQQGNEYGERRYNRFGEREWENYGHQRPRFNEYRDMARSNFDGRRRRNYGYNDYYRDRPVQSRYQREKQDESRGKSKNERNQGPKYGKMRESTNGGTVVPDNRKITFLEKKSKN